MDRFKYGHWLASLGGGSRPHYNIVAVAVGLGIGVAGLCKVLYNGLGMPWATRKKDSSELERVYHIGGLHNLGNNCFLNVILQALASCNSFISFLNNLLETDGTLLEEKAKRMPLIFALSSLLEDLCIIQDERTVLNPRRVMHALSFYVNHFNLTRQQDASEAFIHLLTSLRDESCLCYVPYRSSLADITLSPSKVYKQREGNQPECKRWKQNLFGPFDGTIGSILSCRNCSCVLSMDYENFHCLPLSPVLDISGDIINGCNLVDCLKYFTDVEHLDSYRCDRCWHIAAAKHLSLRPNVDEEKVNKLHACVNYDTCNCMVMFDADEIPCCSSSHALKQLVITQCPKILCIHLQRATVGQNGDLLKLEGHISFPLLLNLSPFVGATSTLREGPLAINIQRQGHQAHHLYWQLNMQMPLHMFPAGRHPSNQPSNNEVTSNGSNPLYKEANVNVAGSSSSTRSKLYSLSAVVEHYGRCGGGHYAAYRRVTPDSGDADPAQPLASSGGQWFYVSDHHVSHISEDAVLAAEATLLFYERL